MSTRLEFKIKRFDALSSAEVYAVLQLRSTVFVVEQNCVYQDIDGKDQKALHVLGESDGKLVAYARLFAPGDYFDQASIGRVVVHPDFRDRKWGHDLMSESILAVTEYFSAENIEISAQQYLQKFYESHGFVQTSEMYLEDDIPHIRMQR